MLRALLLCCLAVSPALAAGEAAPRPQAGRYALHTEACKAGDIFMTLTDERLDLPVFSCTGLDFKPVSAGADRALWQVAGKRCEGEEGKPGPRRFRIEAMGTSLRIQWPDGSKSAPLRRCGR